MKRIFLFVITNFAIMLAFSIAWNVFNFFYPVNDLYGQYYAPLLVFFGIWGMGGAFVSLFMSKWVAKRFYGVQIIDSSTQDPQMRHLVDRVHNISRAAGLKKMPEVGIYQSPEVNAFATGPSKNNSLVALSTGLLSRMDSESVDGVIGHEVAHVANGDMVTMTLIQGVVNAFVLFFSRVLADIVANAMSDRDEGPSFLVHMVLNIGFQIVFGFIGMFVVAFFSRIREYRADLGSAKTVGKQQMIKALQALKNSVDQLEADEGAMATMKIASLPSMLSTHPSLDDRIQRLERATTV
jgi:heat shock protein HtpX